MPMDKNWLFSDRRSTEWHRGMNAFLDMAFEKVAVANTIRCPCSKCLNIIHKKRDEVAFDLLKNGMDKNYTNWTLHGEEQSNEPTTVDDDNISNESEHENYDDAGAYEMVYNIMRGANLVSNSVGNDNILFEETLNSANATDSQDSDFHLNDSEEPNMNAQNFFRLLKDAEQELYPGCKKVTKLSFIVRLLQIKCLYGLSDKSCEGILGLFKLVLPDDHLVPDSMYNARKIIRDLGFDYEKIDACVNDCLLYRNGYASLDHCPMCMESRWKTISDNQENDNDGNVTVKRKKKKVPQKILRYFPLTPRLQRLFMTKDVASYMRWHKELRVNDGVLRHPADSMSWKHFDQLHSWFAHDARNVRLGLATDGFNPYGVMSLSYSTWPVILIPYNLPPWLCLKQPFWIMSMLIPGPKSPGNNIDVYLEPLIDELRQLWEHGVETYDASSQHNFKLHAAILWTISDFPAYAMLSGWSTKGELACPCCSKDTSSTRLKFGRKYCYMGHRRFLEYDHPWRRNKSSFNNMRETKEAPVPLSGDEILQQYEQFEQVTFGRITRKRKRDSNIRQYNWRKKSIFFQLPYWKTLLLRHNLDVMHIEKNLGDNVLGTLLGMEGKTKDNLNARLDLQVMGIRKDLHPVRKDDKYILPPACYTLSTDEKRMLCQFLKDVKMPDGYASNIGRCVQVKECRMSGLKTHDCHIIFQRLLPLAIRDLLPKKVCEPLIELSNFFVELCSKELMVDKLDQLNHQIARTLCKLEQIFPPAFFDVMVHLPIHLANECKLAGPVQYRWMFPVERFLRTLKGNMRNKAHPEGSIAEGYITEECMTFCTHYLQDVETKLNRQERYADIMKNVPPSGLSVFTSVDNSKFTSTVEWLNRAELHQAHHYILSNCVEIAPWIDEHIKELTMETRRNVERRHKEQFAKWFENRILQLHKSQDRRVNDHLLSLARGPDPRARVYNRYVINGFLFRTKEGEQNLKTQNSGVVVKGDEHTGHINWFGVIRKIIALNYLERKEVVLFKCDWFEVPSQGRIQSRGYKKDEYGFISIDTTRLHYKDDPFILGIQAEQVFYAKEVRSHNWCNIIKVKPRNLFSMPIRNEVEDEIHVAENETYEIKEMTIVHDNRDIIEQSTEEVSEWGRNDIEGVGIDLDVLNVLDLGKECEEESSGTDIEDDDTYIDDDNLAFLIDTDIDEDDHTSK